jgi:hypothetical protein
MVATIGSSVAHRIDKLGLFSSNGNTAVNADKAGAAPATVDWVKAQNLNVVANPYGSADVVTGEGEADYALLGWKAKLNYDSKQIPLLMKSAESGI